MDFFSEFAKKIAGHFTDCEFQLGMLFIVVLFLIAFLATLLVRRRNRKRREILVSEEGGDLVISRKAFCDFVRNVVGEFQQFRLVDAWFEPSDEGMFRVKLKLKAAADVELTTLHNTLRERLNSAFKAKLGLADKVCAIDMKVVALPNDKASEAKTPEDAAEA